MVEVTLFDYNTTLTYKDNKWKVGILSTANVIGYKYQETELRKYIMFLELVEFYLRELNANNA